jgi:hypothetical protein
MSETVTKEGQTPWNCMWVRLRHLAVGIPKPDRPDDLWLCVRPPGRPRYVTREECSECKFWEPDQPEAS